MTTLLRWNDTERYEDKFYIGSEDGNGKHLRNERGWPYSIYRKATQIGFRDVVICRGIQNLDDAREIADRLQGLA